MAVAIDPIKERTYKAYGSLSTNLEFAEGGASDCWKFGMDFDLLADQEREEAFTGILKCMKPNALFAFCTAASGNHNMAFLLKKISCNKYFLRNYHPTPKLELEQLLSEYRFKDVALKKTEINLSMPTLDIYIFALDS